MIYSQEYLKSLILNFLQKIYLKNESKRKRNFTLYHFLVESKPHERIDLLTVNILSDKKKYSNSNPLSTNPPISEQFFS